VKTQKDFGVGWTLDLKGGSYEHNRTPGEGWEITKGGGLFSFPCQTVNETLPHVTEVRLSDREFYVFALTLLNPDATLGGCFADPGFNFIAGSTPGATLQILGNTRIF